MRRRPGPETDDRREIQGTYDRAEATDETCPLRGAGRNARMLIACNDRQMDAAS